MLMLTELRVEPCPTLHGHQWQLLVQIITFSCPHEQRYPPHRGVASGWTRQAQSGLVCVVAALLEGGRDARLGTVCFPTCLGMQDAIVLLT